MSLALLQLLKKGLIEGESLGLLLSKVEDLSCKAGGLIESVGSTGIDILGFNHI